MGPKPGEVRGIHVSLKLVFRCSVAAVLITAVILAVQNSRPDSRPPLLSRDNPPSPESFAPQRMLNQQPPITELKVIAANEVQGEVEPDELVLGVVIDGENHFLGA